MAILIMIQAFSELWNNHPIFVIIYLIGFVLALMFCIKYSLDESKTNHLRYNDSADMALYGYDFDGHPIFYPLIPILWIILALFSWVTVFGMIFTMTYDG